MGGLRIPFKRNYRKSDQGLTIQERYTKWLANATDPVVAKELSAISGHAEEISDRFYRDLEFGTGGLRGILGAGTNRMNIYTVAKATQGYCNYLLPTLTPLLLL